MRRRHLHHPDHHRAQPGRRHVCDRKEQTPRPGWQRAGLSVLRWYALAIGIGLVLIIALTAVRAAFPIVILAVVVMYVAIEVSGRTKPPSGGHRVGRGSED